MIYKVLVAILGLSYIAGSLAQHLPIIDSCIVCTSFNDTTCATKPDALQRTPCPAVPQLLGCYSRIVDGFTVRGCAAELDEIILTNCSTETCGVCIGIQFQPVFGCNNEIFPEHRRQCHICQEPVNGSCDGIPQDVPTVCDIFHPTDRCFVHRTATTITRGCMSDHRASLCANPSDCHICELSGCNNISGDLAPVAPDSAVTNKISIVMLSTAFLFALAKMF